MARAIPLDLSSIDGDRQKLADLIRLAIRQAQSEGEFAAAYELQSILRSMGVPLSNRASLPPVSRMNIC